MIPENTQVFPYWQASGRRTELPAGYTFRPCTMADAEAVSKLLSTVEIHYTGYGLDDPDDLRDEWQSPGFDLEGNTCLAIDAGGQVVAYYELHDIEPHVRLSTWGRFLPEHEAALGNVMLDWALARSAPVLPQAPQGTRVVLRHGVLSSMRQSQQILQAGGYQHIRNFLRMVIDLDEPPAAPQWPAGIEVRTMRLGEDNRRTVEAVRASFRDHWGFVEVPFEKELQRMEHLWQTFEIFRPENYFLAWDGDQVAGISLCYHHLPGQDDLGWVGTLGVLRPWRSKGLGLALLQHSFCELYRQGQRKIGLGVDASSLTGATRLYEKAGMRSDPSYEMMMFEKELRPGLDLTTQDLAE